MMLSIFSSNLMTYNHQIFRSQRVKGFKQEHSNTFNMICNTAAVSLRKKIAAFWNHILMIWLIFCPKKLSKAMVFRMMWKKSHRWGSLSWHQFLLLIRVSKWIYSSQFGIYSKFIGKNLGPSLSTWFTLLELVDPFRKKVIGLALSKGADSKLRSLEASLNQVVLRSVGMWKWICRVEMWKYVKSRIFWDQMMIFLFEKKHVRSWILRKKHHTWTCRCSKIVESPSWMMGQCFEAQDAIIKSC